MGKKGSWIQSLKKAVQNHLTGGLDRDKFQHLHAPSSGKRTTSKSPNDSRDCSTASSNVVDEQHIEHRRSSSSCQEVGRSGHQEQEEKRRSSTSSQILVQRAGSGHHKRSLKNHDKTGSRSNTSSCQDNGGSGYHTYKKSVDDESPLLNQSTQSAEELYRQAATRRGDRGSGDHSHLVKLYREERAGGSNFYDRSNKEEKGRSSISLEKRNGTAEELRAASEEENPRCSKGGGGGGGGHKQEKKRLSTSSQKDRSAHEKPQVENGRSDNVSTHSERTVVEKARLSTSSNHNVKTSSSSTSPSGNRRPSTPSSPDERTKSLLAEIPKTSPQNMRPSTDKGRPKTPSSPKMAQLQAATEKIHSHKSRSTTGPVSSQPDISQQRAASIATRPTGPHPQPGRTIALQDLLKPPSFERKSSSSSTASVSHVGGKARSMISDGSNPSRSEEFVELVFPLLDTARPPSPAVTKQQRRNTANANATIREVFSLHEYEAPVSPASQRRKSGHFNTKTLVPLPELGTKPLLPPNYRKQQPAVAVADLGTFMFHAGDAGVGGMFGEWAAVMIQSSWRGYVARQVFKLLRGLVKLQALVRGYLTRKKMKPLVNARIQAARVRNKLGRNTKIQLHPISNGYGIVQTVLENQSRQCSSAQPVIDGPPKHESTRKSPKTLDALLWDVGGWNSPVTLCTSAELKQEVLMKKERAKHQEKSPS